MNPEKKRRLRARAERAERCAAELAVNLREMREEALRAYEDALALYEELLWLKKEPPPMAAGAVHPERRRQDSVLSTQAATLQGSGGRCQRRPNPAK